MKKKLLTFVMVGLLFISTTISVYGNSNYTVKSGDTIYSISKKYNLTASELMKINNLKTDELRIGQSLSIPDISSPTKQNYITYNVKKGDTLGKLAEYFGTTITSIKSMNNMQNDLLKVNDKLKIMANYDEYTVQPGDTLWTISKKFNLTVSNLEDFNNFNNNIILKVNDILKIPHKKTTNFTSPSDTKYPTITYSNYTVVSGDNPWSISVKYGIPMTELLTANKLPQDASLRIGQIIKIPVHHIPVMSTPSSQFGEYLDWWNGAQYVFPIGKTAKVTDFYSKTSFYVQRTIGAFHADCEPCTINDRNAAYKLWNGFSWITRPVLVEVDGRKIAGSMTFFPHGVEYITNNNFGGHFDIHFLNSTRHKDGALDPYHQEKIKISSGMNR